MAETGRMSRSDEATKVLRIYCHYAKEDVSHHDTLARHLSPLLRSGEIALRGPHNVLSGEATAERVREEIAQADWVLVLVSVDLIASDWTPIRDALAQKKPVVPVLLRPCRWQTTELAGLSPLPMDRRFIVDYPVIDAAWTEVAEGLRWLRDRPALRNEYLDWLIEANARLEVRGLQRPQGGTLNVPLDRVYVALKVDASNYLERAAARQRSLEELAARIASGEFSAEQREEALRAIFTRAPLPSFVAARQSLEAYEKLPVLNAGEICRDNRDVVILGDPGSGKTTITRWLAVCHAAALRRDREQVAVRRSQIDPLAPADAPEFALGEARLPVLVRVSSYAEDRQQRLERRLPPRSLFEFLGYHTRFERRPFAQEQALQGIIHAELAAGRALIILDGLDEIPAAAQREEILGAVDAFIREPTPGARSAAPGNQIVVTSRIAGYQMGLRGDLPHYTIEPMTDEAVQVFIHGWMREVEAALPGEAEPAAAARAHAEALLTLLAQPEHRHARELATNPLLASVIATVSYRGHHQLPRFRVELYQAAIDSLLEIWLRRRHDQPQLDLTRHEILALLPTIALYIHEHKPTGYLEEDVLRNLARDELAALRGEDRAHPTVKLRADVDSLLQVVREDVGLLAAGAPGSYRFLHLTFQENLAALGLVRDLPQVPAHFRQRVGDPRWREPLLMALGHLRVSHREALAGVVRQLLVEEGPLADLVPQVALLVAAAIPQMSAAPEDVVIPTAKRLLLSYTSLLEGGRLSEIRARIERAFQDLRKDGHDAALEALFVAELRCSGEDAGRRAAACAALITRIDFVSLPVAEALSQALPRDRAAWEHPITKALGRLVSPAEMPDPTTAAAAVPRLAVSSPAWRLRGLLARQPELVEKIMVDPEWSQLVVALYGGYWDLDAEQAWHEYWTKAAYLQLEDGARVPFTMFFRERWGREKPIYRMAEFLDTKAKGLGRRWGARPAFNPAAIYRDSPWTDEIFQALLQGAPAGSLRDALQAKRSSGIAAERCDALLALWALDAAPLLPADPVVKGLALARLGSLRASLRDSVLRAAPAVYRDGLILLRHSVADGHASRARTGLLVDAILGACLEAGAAPIKSIPIDGLPAELRRAVLAEELAYHVQGLGDNLFEGSVAFAKKYSADQYAPSELVKALQRVGTAGNLAYGFRTSTWPVDPLVLGRADQDLPLETLDALERMPLSASVLQKWAFQEVLPALVAKNPELKPEVLVLVQAALGQHSERYRTLSLYDHEVATAAVPGTLVAQRVNAVRDPYLRARARLRLARHVPAYRDQSLLAAAEDAAQVRGPSLAHKLWSEITGQGDGVDGPYPGPREAFELWERIAHDVGPARREFALKRAHACAKKLTNPVIEVRAWLKLARYDSGPGCDDALRRACAAARKIPLEAPRARWIRAIAEHAWDRSGIRSEVERIAAGLTDPTARAYAQGQTGALLASCRNLLIVKSGAASADAAVNQMWVPLLLFFRAADELAAAARAEQRLSWAALAAGPSSQAAERVLAAHQGEPIMCSGPVARSLDRISGIAAEQVLRPIYDRLVRLQPDAEPIVQRWLSAPAAAQARIAALLLAEVEDLRPESLAPVLRLLRDPDDLLRARAGAVIHRQGRRDLPTRTVTGAGVDVIEHLTLEAQRCGPTEPGVAVQVTWYLETVLLDSVPTLDRWCDVIEDGRDGTVAARILSRAHWITDAVWECLLARFRRGGEAVREAVLCLVARLVHLCRAPLTDETRQKCPWLQEASLLRMTSERWAAFWHAVRDVGPAGLPRRRVLLADYADILLLVRARLAQTGGRLDAAEAARASAALWEAHAADFAGLLGAPLDEALARKNLQALGNLQYATSDADCHGEAVKILRKVAEEEPAAHHPWAGYLALWAASLLRASPQDDRPSLERCYVLELAAAAADLYRDSFLAAVDRGALEGLLVDAVRYHNAYPGRAAAMRLLGFLEGDTQGTLSALQSALRDVVPVQQAAIDAAPRFHRLHRAILPDLLAMLYDQSALTAYTTAQLLVAVAQRPGTAAEVHRQIIDALARAARDQRSRRTVHFGHTDARIPDMPQLDDAFAAAVCKVCRID